MFFFFDDNVNNVVSNLAFESFTINVLKDYAEKQGKELMTSEFEAQGFDAYLPNGIDDLADPIYVEVKYLKTNNSSYFRSVREYSEKATNKGIKNILFILGREFTEESKVSLRKLANSIIRGKVIIWDINDFNSKTNDFQKPYMEYLENPQKAIVDDAINSEISEYQKNATKVRMLDELKSMYNKEEVVLFLGAGISIDAGIPLWSDLVNKLLATMIKDRMKSDGRILSREQIDMLVELANENKEDSTITQMRYIRTAYTKSEYNRIVHSVLYENKPKANTALLSSIADLCKPKRKHIGIKAVVTYNFDDLLEQILNKKNIDNSTVFRESDFSASEKLSIYHVHGYMPKKMDSIYDYTELVFSEEDYHKVYRDAYCWSNITQLNFFRENTCLFIGCSLNDPNLRRLLDVAARSGEKPRHYALIKKNMYKNNISVSEEAIEIYKGIDDNLREKYYAGMGLNIIWFKDYHEIPELLKTLLE